MENHKDNGSVRRPFIEATNLVILGKQGTGKTTIFNQFCAYFETKKTEKQNSPNRLELKTENARIIVSDINLPDHLTNICMYSLIKGDAFVLVYDIGDTRSFAYVERIKNFLTSMKGDECVITFVGNKCDLGPRSIPCVTMDCLVMIEWGMKHIEVSAAMSDTVPAILHSVFSNMALTQFLLPESESVEGKKNSCRRKHKPLFKTDSSRLSKQQLTEDRERMSSLVARGIIPEPVKQEKPKKRLSPQKSLVNFLQKFKHD